MNWKQALLNHYTAPLEKPFRQFRNGAMFFFTGLVIVYCANQLLQPSLRQELAVLSGLLMLGAGFLLAMLAQVRLVISRILGFFLSGR
ncbi:MAG: hypothetical protein P8Y42_04810 [Exilibacterium sp.]